MGELQILASNKEFESYGFEFMRPRKFSKLSYCPRYDVRTKKGERPWSSYLYLSLTNVTTEDSGSYDCISSNSEGTAEQSVKVSVSPSEKRGRLTGNDWESKWPGSNWSEVGDQSRVNERINSQNLTTNFAQVDVSRRSHTTNSREQTFPKVCINHTAKKWIYMHITITLVIAYYKIALIDVLWIV